MLRRGITYITLEDQVLVDDRRGFLVLDPIDSVDSLPPTPIADRQRMIREFRQKHKSKVYQIQEAAGVQDPE